MGEIAAPVQEPQSEPEKPGELPPCSENEYKVYFNTELRLLYEYKEKLHDEPETYFYHPDHLGSSSWITDQAGDAIQHLQYLPFGEQYVDQRTTGWNAPYTFSGKERDEETGYGYFGARYYDSDLSIWLSVDPLADKYPMLSPYVYCANNPIKLVDPDGREIGEVDEASQKKIDALTNKNSVDYSKAFARKFKQLEKSDQVYNFYSAESGGEVNGLVAKNADGKSIDIISSEGGSRTSPEGGFSSKYATIFEEVFHATEYDKGKLDLSNPTCRDEAKAWKFATNAPGTNPYSGFKTTDAYGNVIFDRSFAGAVREMSLMTLAKHFKNGTDSYINKSTGVGYNMMNGKDGKGLYKHLYLK